MLYGRMAGALLAAITVFGGAASAQQLAAADSVAPAGATSAAPARPRPARRPSRMHAYVHDVLGPGAWVGVGSGATLEQVRTDPTQWGTGLGGFGDRLASTAGDLVVQESVRHGLAAALGRSTEYERCGCSAFGPRVSHAFLETFTDRDDAGRREFSVPRVAGAVAGGVAPMLWMPGATVASSAVSAGVSLLLTAAGNVASEYLH